MKPRVVEKVGLFSSVSLLFWRMIDEGRLEEGEGEREIWKRDIILAKVGHRTRGGRGREKKKERIRECRYSTRERG